MRWYGCAACACALVACMQVLTTARAHFPTGTAARRVRAPPGRQLQSPRLRGATGARDLPCLACKRSPRRPTSPQVRRVLATSDREIAAAKALPTLTGTSVADACFLHLTVLPAKPYTSHYLLKRNLEAGDVMNCTHGAGRAAMGASGALSWAQGGGAVRVSAGVGAAERAAMLAALPRLTYDIDKIWCKGRRAGCLVVPRIGMPSPQLFTPQLFTPQPSCPSDRYALAPRQRSAPCARSPSTAGSRRVGRRCDSTAGAQRSAARRSGRRCDTGRVRLAPARGASGKSTRAAARCDGWQCERVAARGAPRLASRRRERMGLQHGHSSLRHGRLRRPRAQFHAGDL